MDYITLDGYSETSFFERRSEFIGYIKHVETNSEAVDFINYVKAVRTKATHNVYAYILRANNATRYSDDGEPQGTAGIPVFDVLRKNSLTDVCCVVKRYFGGILLGGGGLVRAYTKAAAMAVDSSTLLHMCSCRRIVISADYSSYGKLTQLLAVPDVLLKSTDFSDNVRLELLVKDNYYQSFSQCVADATNARASASVAESLYADFPSAFHS